MEKPILAKVVNGKLIWLNDSQVFLKERLGRFEGDVVSIRLDSASPKTQGQLGLYYGVWLPLIRSALIDAGFDMMGVPPTIDFTDSIVKHFCARLDGKKVVLKRNMIDEQMSKFLTNVASWASINLGLSLPEPDNRCVCTK